MKKRGELVPRRLISGKYDHNRWEEGIKRIRALPPFLSFCFSHEREREKKRGERKRRGEHLSSRKSVLARSKRKRTRTFFASHDSIEAKGRNIGPVKPRKIECTPRKSRVAPSFARFPSPSFPTDPFQREKSSKSFVVGILASAD